MSDLTINSNLASSGKVNHKSIGSNGSFWLPPKMQSMSFDSSLKQLSSSSKTSLAPSGEQAKVSTPGSFNPVKSDLTNRNLSMLRDANFFENRPLQTPGKPLIPSSSPLRSSVKDTGSASSSIIHSMPSAVNSSSVMISSSEAIPQLAPLSHLTIGKSGNSEYVLFFLLLLLIVAQKMLIFRAVNSIKMLFSQPNPISHQLLLRKIRSLSLSKVIKQVRFPLVQAKRASFDLPFPWKTEVQFLSDWSKSENVFKFVSFLRPLLHLNRFNQNLLPFRRIVLPALIKHLCLYFSPLIPKWMPAS